MRNFSWSFNQACRMSHEQCQHALYSGNMLPVIYDARALYHDIIMRARFDHPVTHPYTEDTIMLVYAAILVRLTLMSIAPFMPACPTVKRIK